MPLKLAYNCPTTAKIPNSKKGKSTGKSTLNNIIKQYANICIDLLYRTLSISVSVSAEIDIVP